MLSINLRTQDEIMLDIAARAKERRLAENLTQEGLALRSSVSLGSIKRFEKTAQISLQSLLKIAWVLDDLDAFDELFKPRTRRKTLLEEYKPPKTRKRGSVK